MQFVSVVTAQLGLSFTGNQVEVTAALPKPIGLKCDQTNNTEYKVFFESPIAAFDKCSITINKDGEQDVNVVGMLSDRADGAVTEQIKVKVCSADKVDPTITAPLFNIVRTFVDAQKTCTSHADPHLQTFDGQSYSQYGVGNFWLVKNDYFDIQVQTGVGCSGPTASCNVQVGVRYLDNLWISTLANPQFVCHSANGCADTYGVSFPFSAGITVMSLPGNIKITNAKIDTGNAASSYFNVDISAPGADTLLYTTSQCNPGAGRTDVPFGDQTFGVPAGAEYFVANAVALQKPAPSAIKPGFSQCTLPTSCEQAYPQAAYDAVQKAKQDAIDAEKAHQAALAAADQAAREKAAKDAADAAQAKIDAENAYKQNAYKGKKVLNGFTEPAKSVYKPYVRETKPVDNGPVTKCTVEAAKAACAGALPLEDMAFAKINQKYYIDSCALDYMPASDTQRPGILLGTKQAVIIALKGKLDDCVRTEQDAARKQQCLDMQTKYHFGDRKCPAGPNGQECSSNGVCNAYGCVCKSGFKGIMCETVNAYSKPEIATETTVVGAENATITEEITNKYTPAVQSDDNAPPADIPAAEPQIALPEAIVAAPTKCHKKY